MFVTFVLQLDDFFLASIIINSYITFQTKKLGVAALLCMNAFYNQYELTLTARESTLDITI